MEASGRCRLQTKSSFRKRRSTYCYESSRQSELPHRERAIVCQGLKGLASIVPDLDIGRVGNATKELAPFAG